MTQQELDKIKEIGEELRTTIDKKSGEMAFDYVYKKYEDFFADKGGYSGFVNAMHVCAVFFASRGEETIRDRENTTYKYV